MVDAGDEEFDKVLELAGNDGKFQKRYNYLFNFGFVLCASMAYMNLLSVLETPEYHCQVPGRERYNLTVDEWNNLTLPRETDNRGEISQSSCKMYNVSLAADENFGRWNFTEDDIIDCSHGYNYSKQYYGSTALSAQDWVCEKSSYSVNILSANRLGEVIGTLIFGQLGDTIGRRPVLIISLILQVVSRVWTLLTSSSYIMFIISTSVGVMIGNSIYMCPLVIGMEMCSNENRASMAMLQYLGWTVGLTIMPLVYWWVKDWKVFLILTTSPCLLFLLFPRYMIESPRWLATRGKFKECAKELQKIAKINGKPDDIITEEYLKKTINHKDVPSFYGIGSLFSSYTLGKNTLIITSCWSLISLGYYILLINSTKLGGNPFLSFSWQVAAEMPSYFIGRFLADKYGRRFTNIFSFGMTVLMCLPIIYTVRYIELKYWTIMFSVLLKFFSSINFYVINLVQIEIFPTCLRQIGISFGAILANILGILAPSIVNLGAVYDIRYPFIILTVLYLIGTLLAFFVPETLHQKLPDTLNEAKVFGLGQKFWSFPKSSNKVAPENFDTYL